MEIDKLTRSLMEGTAEQPSSSLISRIMDRVFNERKILRKVYVKRLPSLGFIFGVLAVYIFLVGGGLYFFVMNPDSGGISISEEFKQLFPILLTIGAGISFAFFFSQLDKWLFSKIKHSDQKQDIEE